MTLQDIKTSGTRKGTSISLQKPDTDPDSIAVLLPGFLDSKDYLHMIMIADALTKRCYLVARLDPCGLWSSVGNIKDYTVTNYLAEVRATLDYLKKQIDNPKDILLIGHSLGGLISIVAGSKFDDVTTIVSLCPPSDIRRLAASEGWKERGEKVSTRDLPKNHLEERSFSVPYMFVEDALKYSAVESVRSLNKPLMIFIANEDDAVPPAETKKIVSAANKPYVVHQEKMGHDFRHSRKETAIVAQHILDFLENTTQT